MTEKNAATLILVAVIGAFGAILAACIGLIPTILPLVRPTATSGVFTTATLTITPSSIPLTDTNTPLPDTPSATLAPTETPTLTPTLGPLETPTTTQTTVPTLISSSSNIDDYAGTWVNVDEHPASERVKLVVTRIDITKTGATTADLSVCRQTQSGQILALPDPAPGSLYDFALVARNFTIPREPGLTWTIFLQQSGKQIVATVQEYDSNNILVNSDTFRLDKPSLLGSIGLQSCAMPPATATPAP